MEAIEKMTVSATSTAPNLTVNWYHLRSSLLTGSFLPLPLLSPTS